ncbi:MAG: hypothetical protein QM783_02910 [Phycisphaerales bacterium]
MSDENAQAGEVEHLRIGRRREQRPVIEQVGADAQQVGVGAEAGLAL